MSTEFIHGLITILESDTADVVLERGHDPKCLKTMLGWSPSDVRIFRFYRPMPLKVPEILIQESSSGADKGAPRYVEDKTAEEVYLITLIAKSASDVEEIETRVRDLLRVQKKDLPLLGMRNFWLNCDGRREFFDVPTETARIVLHYRARSITI